VRTNFLCFLALCSAAASLACLRDASLEAPAAAPATCPCLCFLGMSPNQQSALVSAVATCRRRQDAPICPRLVAQDTHLRPPQRTAVLPSPSCASFRQIHQSARVLLRSCLSPSTQRSLLVVGAANTQRLVALLPVTVDTVLSTRGRRRKTRHAAQMPALPAPSPPAVSCPLDPLDAGKAAITFQPVGVGVLYSNTTFIGDMGPPLQIRQVAHLVEHIGSSMYRPLLKSKNNVREKWREFSVPLRPALSQNLIAEEAGARAR
jgi:hypothetical protein